MSDLLKKAIAKRTVPDAEDFDLTPASSEADADPSERPKVNVSDGFSPLDSSKVLPLLRNSKSGHPIYFVPGQRDLVFLCVHGAGLSGSSFAPLVEALAGKFGLATFDLPGHGRSEIFPRGCETPDFSVEFLLAATLEVLEEIHASFPRHSIVLVGHSLGGSLAARLYAGLNSENEPKLPELRRFCRGLVVIETVEGTAVEALPEMSKYLSHIPKSFDSPSQAIKFVFDTQQVRNRRSARLSTPDQLVSENGKTFWRTELRLTEKFWPSWFEGLSKLFIGTPTPKTLILADAERMDKELMIAQMQGKFKLVTFKGKVGHSVHEDDPLGTAAELLKFIEDFRVAVGIEQMDEADKKSSEASGSFFSS